MRLAHSLLIEEFKKGLESFLRLKINVAVNH
jgi:hypothetical protein